MRANAAELGVDPDRIAVSGNSAGGHLSMMVGYASGIPELEGDGGHPGVSSVVQAVVNFYGPVDLTTAYALSRPEPAKFLGMGYDQNPDLFDMASPLHHLSKGDPPTLILHGVIDELVPIRQADRLAARLKELGIPYLYDRYPGWPHTMDLARDVNVRCRFYMNEFFNRHLRDGTADPEPAAQE